MRHDIWILSAFFPPITWWLYIEVKMWLRISWTEALTSGTEVSSSSSRISWRKVLQINRLETCWELFNNFITKIGHQEPISKVIFFKKLNFYFLLRCVRKVSAAIKWRPVIWDLDFHIMSWKPNIPQQN